MHRHREVLRQVARTRRLSATIGRHVLQFGSATRRAVHASADSRASIEADV